MTSDKKIQTHIYHVALKWRHVHQEINTMMKNIQGTPTRIMQPPPISLRVAT